MTPWIVERLKILCRMSRAARDAAKASDDYELKNILVEMKREIERVEIDVFGATS